VADATRTIRINIDTAGAEAQVRRVNAAVATIGKGSSALAGANDNNAKSWQRLTQAMAGTSSAGGAVNRVLDEIRTRSGAAIPLVGNLVTNLAAMGPIAGIVGAVALAIGAVAVASVKAAAQTQQWKANLLTMTKDVNVAQSAYAGLVDFANKTPFSLGQSIEGFTKLRALGLATSTDIMTSYGNTAAAMGKDMSQIIEAVADATTGEFERLKEFGIKAKQSGDNVAFTFQGVTTTVKKNGKDIQDYIVGIGKTNFGGAMARQMDSLSGAFSNLSDKVFLLFARMGEGELGKAVAGITNSIADGVGAVTPLLGGLMDILGGIVRTAYEITKGVISALGTFADQGPGAYTMMEKLSIVVAGVGSALSTMGQIVGNVLGFMGSVVGTTVNFIGRSFSGLFDWLIPSFQGTGQSAGESIVGILRAAEFVANQLPNVFKAALAEIKLSFIQVGDAISKTLQGDLSGWGKVNLSFSNTKSALRSTYDGAVATFSDRKSNRAKLDSWAGRTGEGNISFDALGGKPGTAGTASKNSGKNAGADRAKAQQEFWEALKQEAKTASQIGIEAENTKKQLELQKILGRELTSDESVRVNNAVQLVRSNTLLTKIAEEHREATAKASIEESLLAKRMAGMKDDELAIERRIAERRQEALNQGYTQQDLQNQAWKASEEQLRTDLARLSANEKINQQLSQGVGLFEKYTERGVQAVIARDFAGQRQALTAKYNNGNNAEGYTSEDFQRALNAINKAEIAATEQRLDEQRNLAINKWTDVIESVADVFGGVFTGIAGKFAKLMSSIKGESGIGGLLGKLGFGKQFKDAMNSMLKSMGSKIGGLLGKDSPLLKMFNSLGSKIGQIGAGAQMGQMSGMALKALGVKTSNTGSAIGGAIGSMIPALGPFGGLIGGLVGGVFGGLLTKTKKAAVVINQNGTSVSGNSSQLRDSVGAVGGTVQDSIQKIADTLGAEVGNYAVSIGQRSSGWIRVSASGSSKVGDKNFYKSSDAIYNGKDMEEAVRVAVANAIQDGAITGIRATTQALLKAGTDAEEQLNKALKFEGVFKELKSRVNPAVSAIETLNNEMKSLSKIFKEAGASSEEWGKLEELRQLKLKDIMEQQTSSLRNILKDLSGNAGGVSPLAQLTAAMSDLAAYRSDIAAGKQVDQDKFSALVDGILGNAQSLYGLNSTEYQTIVGDIKNLASAAIGNVESAISSTASDPTTNAINSQTDAITQNQQLQTDYLAQILSAIRNGSSAGTSTMPGWRAVNGRLVASA
jgi:hypothetical protein